MTGTAGALGVQAANAEYVKVGQEVFSRPMEQVAPLFTHVMPCKGMSLVPHFIGPTPEAEELLGSRPFTTLREYLFQIPVKPYSIPGLEFTRLQVANDPAIAEGLKDYVRGAANFWEAIITAKLIANPTGYDGVALLSDSHPHAANGGVNDNKTTGTFSRTEIVAAVKAMRQFTNEQGVPYGIRPTHVMVGPKYELEAVDMLASFRTQNVTSTGTLDQASSVVAATAIANNLAHLKLIVNDRLIGTTTEDLFYVMDLSRPGVRPIMAGEALPPTTMIADTASAPAMVERSMVQYWVEGWGAIGAGMWQCIFGKAA